MLSRRDGLDRLLPALAVAYLLAFAGDGLGVYFSGDDLMNLHGYWLAPWGELVDATLGFFSGYYRPLGGLYYRVLYAVFGLEPLPFSLVRFLLTAANIFLAYFVAKKLTRNAWQAGIVAFLLAYHGEMADLYYNGGAVYDLLCFFFLFSAFLVYLNTTFADARRPWLVSALLILALDSKETAASAPLILLLYEVIFSLPDAVPTPKLVWRRYRTLIIAFALTAAYVAGKLSGSDQLLSRPGYRIEASVSAYLAASAHYLEILLYRRVSIEPLAMLAIWAAMAALAAWMRSKPLTFALLFILVSVGPVAFVPLRSGFVYYVPAFGWALYVAAAVEPTVRRIFGSAAPSMRQPAAGAFALIAVLIAVTGAHLKESRGIRRLILEGMAPIRHAAEQLEARRDQLRDARAVLLVDDLDDDWWPLYLTRLLHGDPAVLVHPVQVANDAKPGFYDAVIRADQPQWTLEFHPAEAAAGPLEIRFSPDSIHPGESYQLEIPDWPGETIDIAYRAGTGFFRTVGVATRFCTLDQAGRATLETPRDQPLGPVQITHVRAQRTAWRAAAGRLDVAE